MNDAAPSTYSSPAAAFRAAVAIVGSQSAMARLIGVAQPSVWRWMQDGKLLPAQHVVAVEAATGVSRYDLRPDVFFRDDAPAPAPTPSSDLDAAR